MIRCERLSEFGVSFMMATSIIIYKDSAEAARFDKYIAPFPKN